MFPNIQSRVRRGRMFTFKAFTEKYGREPDPAIDLIKKRRDKAGNPIAVVCVFEEGSETEEFP